MASLVLDQISKLQIFLSLEEYVVN